MSFCTGFAKSAFLPCLGGMPMYGMVRFVSRQLSRFKNAAALALLSAFVFSTSNAVAQDGSGATFDFTAAETAVKDLGDELAGFLTDHVIPAVLVVIAAAVGLLLLFRIVRWVMRAMSGR